LQPALGGDGWAAGDVLAAIILLSILVDCCCGRKRRIASEQVENKRLVIQRQTLLAHNKKLYWGGQIQLGDPKVILNPTKLHPCSINPVWRKDFMYHVCNNHYIVSMAFADPLGPYSRWGRRAVFFFLAMWVFLFVVYVRVYQMQYNASILTALLWMVIILPLLSLVVQNVIFHMYGGCFKVERQPRDRKHAVSVFLVVVGVIMFVIAYLKAFLASRCQRWTPMIIFYLWLFGMALILLLQFLRFLNRCYWADSLKTDLFRYTVAKTGDWRKQLLIIIFHPDTPLASPLYEQVQDWVREHRADPSDPDEYWILERELQRELLTIPYILSVVRFDLPEGIRGAFLEAPAVISLDPDKIPKKAAPSPDGKQEEEEEDRSIAPVSPVLSPKKQRRGLDLHLDEDDHEDFAPVQLEKAREPKGAGAPRTSMLKTFTTRFLYNPEDSDDSDEDQGRQGVDDTPEIRGKTATNRMLKKTAMTVAALQRINVPKVPVRFSWQPKAVKLVVPTKLDEGAGGGQAFEGPGQGDNEVMPRQKVAFNLDVAGEAGGGGGAPSGEGLRRRSRSAETPADFVYPQGGGREQGGQRVGSVDEGPGSGPPRELPTEAPRGRRRSLGGGLALDAATPSPISAEVFTFSTDGQSSTSPGQARPGANPPPSSSEPAQGGRRRSAGGLTPAYTPPAPTSAESQQGGNGPRRASVGGTPFTPPADQPESGGRRRSNLPSSSSSSSSDDDRAPPPSVLPGARRRSAGGSSAAVEPAPDPAVAARRGKRATLEASDLASRVERIQREERREERIEVSVEERVVAGGRRRSFGGGGASPTYPPSDEGAQAPAPAPSVQGGGGRRSSLRDSEIASRVERSVLDERVEHSVEASSAVAGGRRRSSGGVSPAPSPQPAPEPSGQVGGGRRGSIRNSDVASRVERSSLEERVESPAVAGGRRRSTGGLSPQSSTPYAPSGQAGGERLSNYGAADAVSRYERSSLDERSDYSSEAGQAQPGRRRRSSLSSAGAGAVVGAGSSVAEHYGGGGRIVSEERYESHEHGGRGSVEEYRREFSPPPGGHAHVVVSEERRRESYEYGARAVIEERRYEYTPSPPLGLGAASPSSGEDEARPGRRRRSSLSNAGAAMFAGGGGPGGGRGGDNPPGAGSPQAGEGQQQGRPRRSSLGSDHDFRDLY
jgi:hypothetical protein